MKKDSLAFLNCSLPFQIGDLGWQPVYYYLWTSVLRDYCRLKNTDASRLNHIVFLFALDHANKSKNAYYYVKEFCEQVLLQVLLLDVCSQWLSLS